MGTLALLDETQTVVTDMPQGREYALVLRVEGLVGGALDQLGTAVNALYAQALRAVLTDAAVGALVMDIEEGPLEVTILRQGGGVKPSAGFVLELTARYFQRRGATPRREAIMEALEAALVASTAPGTLSVRERALAALRTHLETGLGFAIGRNTVQPVQDVAATIFCDGDQEADHDHVGQTLYAVTFGVELFAPNSDEAALATRAEAVLSALRTADRLGGLAVDAVDATLDPEALHEAYTGPALGIRVQGIVTIATVENDPLAVAA